MVSKDRHYRRSRIAEKTFRQLIRYFSLDLSASDTAQLTSISVRSGNSIYIKLRHRMAEECEKHMFYYHLKETEFRFNHRRDDLYLVLLKLLRGKPI